MTAAVAILATTLAAAMAALVALGWRHLALVERTTPLTLDNERLRADLAQRTDELAAATEHIRTLDAALAMERTEKRNARISDVVERPAHERGPAIDRMLAERAAEQARATPDRGDAAHPAVPGPGAATDGPQPTWADLDGA